ncbi:MULTISPECIES: tetratricopeptide repeat-containing sensor histidine kinase [unclassified Carboxylicivirga]|uniref:tetratricopeptide repeat-containing sensor histidine kinase n=1 Tax=Carboxylicivirga TaxID=1628153 RepID=UPI003D351FCA
MIKKALSLIFICVLFGRITVAGIQDSTALDNWNQRLSELLQELPLNGDSVVLVAHDHIDKCPGSLLQKEGYAHLLKAEYAYYQQEFNESLADYQASLKAFVAAKDSSKLAVLFNNIGLIHYLQANYSSALQAYNKSLELELLSDNKIGIAQSYQNLGMIYGKWERYDQVFEYYNHALHVYEELNDSLQVADIHNNMAVIAVRMGNYEQGFSHYKEAFEAYKAIGDEGKLATVAYNLGRLFFQDKQTSRANEYFASALEIFERLDDKVGLVHTYNMMGEMYLKSGAVNKAIKCYNIAEKYNEAIGLNQVRFNNLQELYLAYKSLGEYKKANEMLERSYALKDSIFDEEQYEKLLELEQKYHSEKNQKELVMLRAEQERDRMYLLVLSMLAILLLVLAIIVVYLQKLKARQRRLSMEHKVMRTQMNPHFIFNSLSALQCIIMENNREDAVDFVADFSGLMRHVLQYAQEEQITLRKEKEILDYYMRLQNRRFDNRINYSIDFDEQIDLERVLVPPMLTQPFLENAIEHGQLTHSDSYIHVDLRRKDNCLEFSIEDNGIGIDRAMAANKGKHKAHKSMALEVTRERLRLLNKCSGVDAVNLVLEDLSKYGRRGTRVVFYVPYTRLN